MLFQRVCVLITSLSRSLLSRLQRVSGQASVMSRQTVLDILCKAYQDVLIKLHQHLLDAVWCVFDHDDHVSATCFIAATDSVRSICCWIC
jgi:hypothetical protein